jgi:hypothetical protein
MYIEISLSFGGKALAQVVEWGLMEYDEEETWGWPKKRMPFLVLVCGRLYQRGADGYYFPA